MKMALLSWFRLLILEHKLNGLSSPFGKYNRYRRLCLERNAQTIEEKMGIAQEVLNGPGVSTLEAQDNELYIRRHAEQRQEAPPSPVVDRTPQAQPERRQQA
jgi:hypothetical protein